MSRPKQCVFCGGGPLNLEDVWPKWATALVNDRIAKFDPHARLGRERRGKTTFTNKVKETARIVCKTCNEGWMSKLESKSKPLIAPMITGENWPLSFTPAEQQIVATWGFKTALMVGHILGDDWKLPSRWYTDFRRAKVPPARCQIWLAAYSDQTNICNAVTDGGQSGLVFFPFADGNRRKLGRPTRFVAEADNLVFTYHFFQTIFQVLFCDWHDGRDAPPSVVVSPAAQAPRIWPIENGTVVWPPPAAEGSFLHDEGFASFGRRFRPQ